MQNTKFYAIFLVLVMFFGIFSLSSAISPLMSNVVIRGYGEITSTKVTAKSGSPSDIQAAVDAVVAAGGGAVYVPAGTFHWNGETVNSIGGVDIIGAGSASTILHNDKAAPFNTMFDVDGTNGKRLRISGIRFEGTVTSSNDDVTGVAVEIWRAIDFRVDHCTFIDFPQNAIGVDNPWTGTTRGVIDHNVIDNPYKDVYGGMWGYGVVVFGQANAWDTDINHFLGKYETAPTGFPVVYIEDNHFSRCRHCIASNQGAWYVARHNIIDNERPENFGSIDVHGAASATAPGGRGLEAYNNTVIGSVGYGSAQAFWVRGGGGVIFNNTMQNILYGVGLYKEQGGPVIGQVKDLYIWGNTMDRGTQVNNYANYTENVDYYLYEKSGYAPYPYPHPLTL